MAKAQKGDLIRILPTSYAATNGWAKPGEIAEVTGLADDDSGVSAKGATDPSIPLEHNEYEIHRKAGEEDSPVYTCDYCETKLGEIACSTHLGGNFCSVKCGDAYVGSVESVRVEQDAVNSPNHYTQGRFETIEIIEEITQGYSDGYVAYCVGNALKYLSRAPFKHGEPTEDIGKAAKYLSFALERLETQK